MNLITCEEVLLKLMYAPEKGVLLKTLYNKIQTTEI